MSKVVARGESVYQCTVCKRKTRVPTNQRGLDVVHFCTITAGCKGKLNRLTVVKDVISTPALTPAVTGLNDWFQRKMVYTHEQVVASNNWIVKHDLGGKPNIHTFLNTLVDGEVQLLPATQPQVITIDPNTTKLIFDRAETGIVQFTSLASQNTTNAPISTYIPPQEALQVSTNTGLLTIGTKKTDSLINITITFVITGQTPVTITYNNIDNIATASSPWAGVKQVHVNGITYTVRTLDIISHSAAFAYFASGQIPPQGGAFYIEYINSSTPVYDDVIILGAKSPFGPVDKIYDKFVDLSRETSTSGGVAYSFGKIIASSNVIKPAFPLISVV